MARIKIEPTELAEIITSLDTDIGGGTVASTMTVVEDRTDAPVDVVAVEYESEDSEIGANGTILTSYGEPKA